MKTSLADKVLRPGGRPWTFRMTWFRIVLATILGLGVGTIIYRLMFGLGVVTNLTNQWPWAIWTWWKLTGVALAGAGYSTAFMVHFMGKHHWKDIERGAFIVSLFGYLMVCAALILDLGQWYNAWHPLYSWGYHSVMFELFFCISGYTIVQLVEFLYIFEERVPWKGLNAVLKKIYAPLMILGVFLPVFHQSALAGLYVIANGREDPLWWSLYLPLFAVMTSFYVGPSVVMWENWISNRLYGRPINLQIFGEMVKVSAGVMGVYLIIKIADYWQRGVLPELFSGSLVGNFALLELGLGVVFPMVVFLRRRLRADLGWMLTAGTFAIAGVTFNRFNIVITGMVESTGAGWYRPYWMEYVFIAGLAAAVCLAYLFVVENFSILPSQQLETAPTSLRTAGAQVPAGAGRAA